VPRRKLFLFPRSASSFFDALAEEAGLKQDEEDRAGSGNDEPNLEKKWVDPDGWVFNAEHPGCAEETECSDGCAEESDEKKGPPKLMKSHTVLRRWSRQMKIPVI
jgi:hypothetical protein